MNRNVYCLWAFLLVFVMILSGNSYAATNYYATTNMTWAEFYAGELGESSSTLEVSYDAVSTATQRFMSRFNGFVSETSGDGSVFSGVRDVQVRMTENAYNTLSHDTRYTFSNTAFTEYKEVNADGSFGKMISETKDANATLPALSVTLAGGKANTHGNYRLNISGFRYASLDVSLGTSYDNFLGATLQTSDGTVYGMKPLHNLWVRGDLAEQIGFSVEDFTERNGTHLSYAHTADLPGKTIKQITFMLKNQPDPVITCDVYVKRWTEASATVTEPSDGWLESMGNVSIPLTLRGTPSDASYRLSAVALVEGRNETTIDSSRYEYNNGVLTFKGGVAAGSYKATFTDAHYVDVTINFSFHSTDATSKIISPDTNNAGHVNFLLTPQGAVSSVDAFVSSSSFVNADTYTSPDKNFSATYSSGANIVTGSGFSFDIVLDGVPADKSAVVGVGKQFYLTPDNCGELYPDIYSAINALPVGESGYREISDGSFFKSVRLQVISVYGENIVRDITEYIGAGAMISDDRNILIFYGAMLADRDITNNDEGNEYLFSPEGETLISDGIKDNHLKATWYFETLPVDNVVGAIGSSSSGCNNTLAPIMMLTIILLAVHKR